jgi:DNA-binding MarR family transcriptional regulator
VDGDADDRRRDRRRARYGGQFLNVLSTQSSASFSELARASKGMHVLISETLEWIVQAEQSGLVEYLPMLGDKSVRRVRLTAAGRTIAGNDRRGAERRAA